MLFAFIRRRRKQRVRELWSQQHAVVAEGRYWTLPVQRVWPLHQNQWHEPAAGKAAAEEIGGNSTFYINNPIFQNSQK